MTIRKSIGALGIGVVVVSAITFGLGYVGLKNDFIQKELSHGAIVDRLAPQVVHSGDHKAHIFSQVQGAKFWSRTGGGQEWVSLARKSLLTQHERDRRRALLSDPMVIESAVRRLIDFEVREWTESEERDRFRAVDFIRELLASRDVEIHRTGVNAAMQVLAADLGSFRPNQEGLLRSRVGDRLEIFKAVLVNAPDRVSDVGKNVRDRRVMNSLIWVLQQQKRKGSV